MVIGESHYFGAKLLDESSLWSEVMSRRLAGRGLGGWEVINASMPGYNHAQFLAWWRQELREINPQALFLCFGANDVSQARVMGDAWTPGKPWPMPFIRALQRKSPWWQKPLNTSAIYFLWRRGQMTESKGFEDAGKPYPRELVWESNFEAIRSVAEDALARGCKVALIGSPIAFDENPDPVQARRLDGIQSNWRENLASTGALHRQYLHDLITVMADRLGVPGIDPEPEFKRDPRYMEKFIDTHHWNAKGHEAVASLLFDNMDRLGWWS